MAAGTDPTERLMLRVAVLGSECTGKTTLCRELAQRFACPWAPEYVREYCETHPVLGVDDVPAIMRGQIAAEEAAQAEARGMGARLIVCDTIPLCSLIYSEHYNGVVPIGSRAAAERPYDLYFLTGIDVPWVPDGVRDRPRQRAEIHALFAGSLDRMGIAYTLITGDSATRAALAAATIKKKLHETNGVIEP